jgi:hypothetical protein
VTAGDRPRCGRWRLSRGGRMCHTATSLATGSANRRVRGAWAPAAAGAPPGHPGSSAGRQVAGRITGRQGPRPHRQAVPCDGRPHRRNAGRAGPVTTQR